MIPREVADEIRRRLAFYPGVVLFGPRQVGKTTLARAIAADAPGSLVLDLERLADRAQLAQPELFLASRRSQLVVLDEVQFAPEIFASLRPEIDADRRPGRFLLLGSASGHLLRQQTESLAGRVSYLELGPLAASEVPADAVSLQRLWLRGGFPVSYLAPSDVLSYAWRQDFVQTFLQRDLPAFGVGVAAVTLQRFWRMLAHLHGQLFNASQLGQSLGGASHTTAARYLDVLTDTMMVRRLEPHFVNLGKRLVKSPKIYVRDSGIVHALLGVASIEDLQSHPVAGPSWEGFCVEQIHAHLPAGASVGFYRTSAGTELDVLVTAGKRRVGFEIKFSQAPKPTRGFWQALEDLQTTRAYVVAPVERRYPLAKNVEVIPISDIPTALAS